MTCFVLFVLFSSTGFAQEDVRIKRRNFKIDDKAGFKVAWNSIKSGDDFCDRGRGFYDEALQEYLKAYEYNSVNAALNYKIGVCHFQQHNNEKAVQFFNKALAEDGETVPEIFYLLARAYHLNHEFKNAIPSYQRCLAPKVIDELEVGKERINIYIRQCNNAKDLLENPVRVNVRNLGPDINSEYDDYGPVFIGDSVLYFTSRRKHNQNTERWPGDKRYYSNIYRAGKENGEWRGADLLKGNVFSDHNNAIVEATTDPQRLYVYRGHKDDGDIYYFEHKNSDWRGPKNFSGRINTNAKESSMCFTNNGTTVYFVSEMDKNSFGGKDIFFSKKNSKGKWSDPINVGGLINTSLNEEGVFVNETNDKMYFSSEGHNSMGGYDVFVVERNADGNWQEPENIGYPVNTPYDDVLYRIITGEEDKAYYSTVREDSYGGKDIYQIIFLGEEREFKFSPALDQLAWKVKPEGEILYDSPDKLAIDTTIHLAGIIRDTLFNKGVEAKLEIIDNDRNEIIATHISDTNGRYHIDLPERKRYGVEVSARGYLFFAQNLDLNEMQMKHDTIYKDFVLDRVEVGKKVVLENIYFETNSAKLKQSSYAELERVVKLLRNNPGIKLEISGHTDNVGSYVANKRLSKNRAKSVVDYLIDQGIDSARLTYKGYAFTQPIATNDTPEGRQKNRRVEFEILEK